MKIYNKTPDKLIRLSIFKQGEQREYLTLCDTTLEEVKSYCKDLIQSQNLSIFSEGKKTAITIREAIGASNGKSINLSFRGLSSKETFYLIVTDLKTKNI